LSNQDLTINYSSFILPRIKYFETTKISIKS
jgi:hypothetical protein